jgi:tetratricopeptide (TPR) repeat protein
MIWALAAVAAAILFVRFLTRPSRMVVNLSSAANRAYLRKDWERAVKLLRVARQSAAKVKEPLQSKLTPVIELQLAAVLYRRGQFEEAEDLLRQGLVKGRAVLPSGSEVLVHGEMTWGDLCTDAGRHGEAEQHYRRLLAEDEERGNRGGAVFDLQRVADCLILQERREEAEVEMRRAMQLETSIVKGNVISMCMPDLYFCREEYEEARHLYRVKVEFWETQPALPEQIDLGRLQMRLAQAEARTGHFAEAAEMFARAEATFQREWSAEHPRVMTAREARAALNEVSVRA